MPVLGNTDVTKRDTFTALPEFWSGWVDGGRWRK